MPFDPNKPRSRDEVLLQAIVSGDSTAMGDPRDREEEFVKAIADKETLPDYSEASEGDVLQIGTDGPEWGTVPSELPAIAAGDAGKVLKVNSGETGVEWGEAGGGKLYVNHIYSATGGWGFHCSVVANKRLNFGTFAQFLYGIGATYIAQAYIATGYSNDNKSVIGVYSDNGTGISVVLFDGTTPSTAILPGSTFESVEL